MCMSHEQSMFCNDHYINIIVFMLINFYTSNSRPESNTTEFFNAMN